MAKVVENSRSPLCQNPSLDEEDFVIYQPNPTKQILLYDMATSSSVLTYIKMNGKTGHLKSMTNAEFMSDNGRLPVVWAKNNVDCSNSNGGDIMCGFTEVFWHLARENKYIPSLEELSYIDWVETNFLEAELYICWCHKPIVEEYTWNRYTYDLPWPISRVLYYRKRKQIELSVGKKYKNFDDFIEKFNCFLKKLNKKIGTYNMSQSYLSVDALIYGHTNAIVRSNLDPILLDAINRQRRIMNLRDQIEHRYPS